MPAILPPVKSRRSGFHRAAWSNVSALTPMQCTCAVLAAMNMMQKEIAVELGLTLSTVSKHMEIVNRKLGTHSPLETAKALLLLGLLDEEDFLKVGAEREAWLERWREDRRTSY